MRLMRYKRPDLWGWSPFDQLTTLRDEINRLFERPFTNGSSDAFNTWAPALDLYEDKENFILRAEVPGMKKEDIAISLDENAVTVSGERQNEKHEGSET